MPGEHARLSPSSAQRWLTCPASVRLSAELPEPPESPYALEGTLAHDHAEFEAALALGHISPTEHDARHSEWAARCDAARLTTEQRQDIARHATAYVEVVLSMLEDAGPGAQVFLEQRVFPGVPEVYGTGDAIIVGRSTVIIIDYKYGAGVAVQAYDNAQLKTYGLGALEGFGDVVDLTETVRVVIHQPRVGDGQPSWHDYSADELRTWRSEVLLPGAELALSDSAPFQPSEAACRWCPAAGVCRARTEAALAEDFSTDPDLLSPEEVASLLERLGAIEAWCSAVRDHAMTQAWDHGVRLPGWKVVETPGRRSITDDAAAVEKLVAEGFERDKVQRVQAQTLGRLESLVGKKELPVLLGDLLRKSEGKRTLAPEVDDRPEVTPASQAARDFEEETP